MNHVQENRIAWENAVKAAKAGNRGLQVWPGDRHRVRLEDLAVLPAGWSASLRGRTWDTIPVNTDEMLRHVVKVGRVYALGLPDKDPDGYYMVVEQG